MCPEYGTFNVTVTVTDTAGLTAAATAQVTVPQDNLVCNAGFETDTAGWAAAGTAVTLSQAAGGHSEQYSAAIANTGTATVAECTLKDAAPHWVSMTTAAAYQATLWVRADTSGTTLKLRFREYSLTGGAFLGSQTTTTSLTSGWQQITLTYIPQSPGGSYLEFSAYALNVPPGNCFYADDASITTSTP
jgi:hypothetical protein